MDMEDDEDRYQALDKFYEEDQKSAENKPKNQSSRLEDECMRGLSKVAITGKTQEEEENARTAANEDENESQAQSELDLQIDNSPQRFIFDDAVPLPNERTSE